MQFKQSFISTMVAGLFAGVLSLPAEAVNYSSFTVFGDSLSDAGTYGAQFTTNGYGNVWSILASNALGYPGSAARVYAGGTSFSSTGGNIWAEGGARVALSPGNGSGPTVAAESVQTQVTNYLAATGGTASNSGLYAFWAGANDILYGLSHSPSTVSTDTATAAATLAVVMSRVQAAGARTIIVTNLPDIGSTPLFTLSAYGLTAYSSSATALSQLYNSTLSSSLASQGVHALTLDAYGLFGEIIANPSAFGFTYGNTAVACATASSITCNSSTLNGPANAFLFADSVHPTSAGHQIIADYFMSVVRAPDLVSRTADHVSQLSNTQWTISDSRQIRFLNGTLPERTTDVFVQGQMATVDLNAKDNQVALTGKPNAYTVGFDRNFGSGWFGGIALSLQTDSLNVISMGGSAKGSGLAVNVYGAWRANNLYVNTAGVLSTIDYTMKRNFALGTVSRSESGSNDGSVRGLRIEAGYDLSQGDVRHGPLVGATYRDVHFGNYTENGNRSTSLRFGEQSFDQLRTSFGYQGSIQTTPSLRLSGRVTAEKELKSSERDLTVGVATTTGDMITTAGSNKKPQYTQLALQADWAVSPKSSITATLGGASGSGIKSTAASVNYAVLF